MPEENDSGQAAAGERLLDAEPPASADALERMESADLELGREQSTISELPSGDMFKNKKKKRVGGLSFAVQVEEQVIQTNEEDLTQRREHWQTIQQKASDPNTVRAGSQLYEPNVDLQFLLTSWQWQCS